MTTDTRIDITRVIDLFGHPLEIKGTSSRVANKLLLVNDRFFDAFEDGVYHTVILSSSPDQDAGSITALVHFATSVCDEERRAMYKGWIYGYFSDADLEWRDG